MNKYYVGETSDFEKRLEEHKTGFYENSFTSKTIDWIMYFKIDCDNISQALKIEKHIKCMKSIKYFQSLKKFPEISNNLKNKYK